MEIAHLASKECPPGSDELVIGAGGQYFDDEGNEWCVHSSGYLTEDDVARGVYINKPIKIRERTVPQREKELPNGWRTDLSGLETSVDV